MVETRRTAVVAGMLVLIITFYGQRLLASNSLPGIGERIYISGESTSGTALIGKEENTAPSILFPCKNCHGELALGKQETGLVAPDITWRQLTSGYRREATGGSQRTPYDLKTFATAVTQGLDSDGKPLSYAMPRYQLTEAEVADLSDYLLHLASQAVVGVDDHQIFMRLQLPKNPDTASAIKRTVDAFVQKLNAEGGIYRRQLTVADESLPTAQAFCTLDFRLNPTIPAAEKDLSIGVFAPARVADHAYYLYQHPSDYADVIKASANDQGWQVIDTQGFTVSAIIERLLTHSVQTYVLFHTGSSDYLDDIVHALNKEGLSPVIIVNANGTADRKLNLTQHYTGRIMMVGPPGPESVTTRGKKMWSESKGYYIEPSNNGSEQLTSRLAALSLLTLVVDTLQKTGVNLTQTNFEQALQSQVDIVTDFGPSLSFSDDRRIGSTGLTYFQQR